MERKTKKSNKLLAIVTFSLIILGISTISNAKNHDKNVNVSMKDINIGDTFNLSYNEYAANVNRLLCIEHGQALKSSDYNTYKVKAKVKIEGDSCNDKEATGDANGWNARLAAAIHYTSGVDRRKAMWYYFPNWVDKIGRKFDIDPKYVNTNNDGLPKDLKRKVDNYVSKVKNGYSDTDAYIEQNDTTITTKLLKNEAYSETYRDDYVKVGPFNFEFEPQLASIKVKGIFSGETESKIIDDIIFVQSGEVLADEGEIKSKNDFSILVPINVTKITRIILKTEKITPMKTITAKFAILVAGEGSEAYQNLAIVETSAEPGEPSYYEFEDTETIDTTVNLSIEKVDENNNDIKLSGVGFKFKHIQTELWVKQDSNNKISYVSEAEATTFVTDVNGKIGINKLLLGDYEVKEVIQPNYGYKATTTNCTLSNNSSTVNRKVPNKQLYTKISGKVWIEEHSGKQTIRNDYLDNNDTPAEGVKVYLKDSSGNIVHKIDTTTGNDMGEFISITDANGTYLFEGIEIDKLGDYHIEFEYNGLTYTNVTAGIYDNSRQINIYASQASKAAESTETRDTFNKSFSFVENGGSQTSGITKDASGNKSHNLTYNIANHEATLINKGILNFPIIASTTTTGYSIQTQYETQKALNQVFEGIENINLGLYVREQPNMGVVKDIQSVKVVANNKEHVYEYANRFDNRDNPNESSRFGVEYGNKFKEETYERAVYRADYENAIKDNNPTDFEIYITYKIAIKNESTSLIAQANSIVDYYDSRYTLETVGNVYTSNGGKVENDGNSKISNYSKEEACVNNDYKKSVINLNNMKISHQSIECVYVQFKLGIDGIKAALDHEGNEKELFRNIVEINSYSIYNESGNVYAGIDINSAPGNITPGNKDTYEGDTDTAPAMKLLITESRTMEGTVFLDNTTGELKIGEERLGDGIYKENEDKGIAGVEITLTETSGSEIIYEGIKTDNNGAFIITDFIAGDYILTYAWGGQKVDGTKITVQDYKSTIYNEKERQSNTKWHLLKNNRYSDAFDNMETRNKIDEGIKTIVYDSTYDDGTKMDSATPIMDIGVEYDTLISEGNTEHVYQVKNIDFGIVRRPKQSIELTKQVKAMKVILANGEIISDAQFDYDENGKLKATGEKNYITYMGAVPNKGTNGEKSKTENNKGFVKVELDNELIQGATLEVTYEFKFKNNSEIDYVNQYGKADEDYYKYGNIVTNSKLVTISPSIIVDYLDTDWGYEANKNEGWLAITKEELAYKNIVDNAVFGNDSDNSDIDNRIILYTETLAQQKVEPTNEAKINLHVSKTLTTTEDITLDNETEIVKLYKTGGSKIINIIPGNYVPGNMPQEPDTDVAETVMVTPSTGDNLAYILPISLGIGMLVILGTGIVLIKKKILVNK